MSNDIVVNVDFRGSGPQFLAELSRAVGRAKVQLQEMGQSGAQLSRLETQLARLSQRANENTQAASKAAQATQGWAQKWTPFKGEFQEAEAASKALWKSVDSGIDSAEASLGRATKAINEFDESQRRAAQQRTQGSAMSDWDKEFNSLNAAVEKNEAKLRAAKQAVEDYQNSLSNTRYVLYDVAGTLGILGAAFLVPITASLGVAISMEKEFAQVARTSGVTGSALQDLKGDFDQLYGSLPITYDALAQIGTLAGQLGVKSADIAKFTDVVAKTSAVTDLSVDAAATAFGRLNALIPNVQGQYDRLGSSIAKVGVNSVATESEIVNISTQISSMGAFAGLTAQDIVGLSGALASVGAQPELSRGTITRVFTLMSRAVADGGQELEKFASLSGVSASQFKSTWGTEQFGQTFLGFMKGIQNEGGSAVATLNDLGITSVRDVPLLLRLANAADSTGKAGALLAQTMGDANTGWSDNIELQKQYEIIAATVSARLEILSNNFNLLLQAVGGPLLDGLSEFIGFLTDMAKVATDVAQSDIGGLLIRVSVAVAALAGVLAIAGAGMALFGAASIGVYQSLVFMSAAFPAATAGILGTSAAAKLADGSLKAGAASATLFGRALKALSIIGLAFVLPDIITSAGNSFTDNIEEATGVTRDFESALKNLGADSGLGGLTNIETKLNPIADFFLHVPWDQTTRDLQYVNDELARMANVGDFAGARTGLEQLQQATGKTVDELLLKGSDLTNSLIAGGAVVERNGQLFIAYGESAGAAAAGTDVMGGSLEAVQAEAEAAKDALQEYKDILDAINGTVISAAAASDALQSSINKANEAIKAEGVTFDGTNNSSIAFRESLRDIEDKARDSALAVVENGGSVEDAMGKWNLGRDSLLDLIQGFFGSREEAAKWADANLGRAADVARALDGVKASQDRIDKNPVINLIANTGQAQSQIDGFIRTNDGRRITIYTTTANGGPSNLSVGARSGPNMYATGGSVWGAGTETSDSILARLSNGEFVVRAQAAKAIGHGRLDYMNQTGRLPAFAGGGSVGGGAPGGSGGTQVVELSAYDRALLARAGDVRLSIDGKDIAKASNGANFVSAKRGSN